MSRERATAPDRSPSPATYGNREAGKTFEEAYQDNYAALVRLAYLATGRPDVAEDLVQEAFANTFLRWSTVDQPEAYLRTAVINGTRSWARRQVRERQRRQSVLEAAHQQPNEIFDALERLSERQRHAVILRYYEGLDHQTIAKTLGCTTATARTCLHRALKRLRKEIEP